MDAATLRFDTAADGALALVGALTFANAASAWRDGVAALDRGAASRIELGGLDQTDSAGLACVLALLAHGQRKSPGLRAVNAPEGLRALAKVADAERWIA